MTEPCVPSVVQAWLRRLTSELALAAPRGVESLAAVLEGLGDVDAWIERARFDDAAPYGRQVLWAADDLELMIAGWSRDRPCAPHDHGPGQGAVRVLCGRARHRGFSLHEGTLRAGADQRLRAGAVLRCPRRLVHQMQDDGDARPLVTLHAYVGSTVPMTVYDLEHGCTQWLGSGCGAWPRPLGDPEVLRWAPGLVPG